jgi:cell division protein FtsB
MKKQSNSFSLLSIIDKLTKPNLNEAELNEINPVAAEDALATLKNLGTNSKGVATSAAKAIAQDIVNTMSKGGQAGEAIHVIKNNNLSVVTTGDDLILALKAGTIDAVNLARVNKGILKSATVTDVNVLRNIASDVVYETGFVTKYGAEYLANGENAARKLLQDNGYTRNAIDEMIKKMKVDANYGKNVVGLDKEIAKLKSQNKNLRAKIKKKNQQGQTIEVQAKTDGSSVKPTQDGGLQITEPVPTGGTPATPVNVPPNRIKELVAGIKSGWNWKKASAWAAAIGLGAWGLWWAIYKSSDTIPNDMPLQEPPVGGKWAPCIQELLTSKEGQMGRDGSVVVKPADFPGGLQFYNNGRVMDVVGKKMGTWKCKGTKAVIAETQKISLVGLLNEQGGEVDVKTMTDYVNVAINDLDGFVDTGNLTSLLNTLKKLNGKTFQGKNAISEFLSLYKDLESGDDFIADVNSVGVATLDAVAVLAKRDIIALAKSGGSATTPKPNTGNKTGLGGIDIIWDGQKKADEKIINPIKKSKYHDCSGKDTFEFGCRAPKIKEIQTCLGMEERYQTGNFGPLTKKALQDAGYDVSKGITVDIYNKIKAACTDNSNVRAPKLGGSIEPLKTNKTPIAPVNVDNLKLPNLQPVGQGNRGESIYKGLKNNYGDGTNPEMPYIFSSGGRIKYKGDDLGGDVLGQLDQYIETLGYQRIKEKDKDYGVKYVWAKQ